MIEITLLSGETYRYTQCTLEFIQGFVLVQVVCGAESLARERHYISKKDVLYIKDTRE